MRLKSILPTILLGSLLMVAGFFVCLMEIQRGQAPSTGSTSSPQAGSEQARPNFASQNLGGQAFLLPVSETSYLPVRDFNVPEPVLEAKAALLFDVRSGRSLFSKNPNQRLPIASITKLMSAVIILDNLNLNDVFTVPPEDINVDGKGADFYKNEQLRGTDLFKIMLIKSSNDAALAFATVAQKAGIDFVAKMNEKAQAIGMANTKFADPAGLNDHDAFSTASDLVKLVRYAARYDLISQALRTKSVTVTSIDGRAVHNLVNTNQLLGQIPDVIMGKTGYTDSALGTMALEAGINEGRDTIISVILGAKDRFTETEKLIQWSKTAYRWR
ncbi:MAG: serine hydrolase [bacterium]|nr:serine hydrolase [bacterium]